MSINRRTPERQSAYEMMAAEIAQRDQLRLAADRARAIWMAAKRDYVRANKALLAFPLYRDIAAKYGHKATVVRRTRCRGLHEAQP